MSRKTTITCDRCSASSAERGSTYGFSRLRSAGIEYTEVLEADLCPECASDLKKWLEDSRRHILVDRQRFEYLEGLARQFDNAPVETESRGHKHTVRYRKVEEPES